ncbi:PhzF family phenazine biosynthesis protein [Sneathiella glossodoripedis]|uniref:PhzF family phenazine biosynthesis protein n=1 Tax=Sneathiella glossodoripedis TaxID=418853 RepID=UPI00046E7B5C|nr:PhzF family phenazine biosynthesis protein [Sneathiella glossodoripedis]
MSTAELTQTSPQSERVTAHIVNAFVKDGSGGNPAGVVLDADHLSAEDRLKIAAKVGLSETAFVSKSPTETIRLEFFTPNRQIAHCGHATVATFSYLASIGRVGEGEASKETIEGPRKILLKDGAAYMEQLAPKYSSEADWLSKGVTNAAVLASVGLSADQLQEETAPIVVNTGNNFLILAVKNSDILKAVSPDQAAINEISEKLDLIGYYLFSTDTSEDFDATTRMFAPRYGIEEEAATGMAAGPLACYLYDKRDVKKESLLIEQGRFMREPSPSKITVNLSLENGAITGLMAGGFGKVMNSIEVEF